MCKYDIKSIFRYAPRSAPIVEAEEYRCDYASRDEADSDEEIANRGEDDEGINTPSSTNDHF